MAELINPDLKDAKAALNEYRGRILVFSTFGTFVRITKKEALRLLDTIFTQGFNDGLYIDVGAGMCFISKNVRG